jgi:hypothetical protein
MLDIERRLRELKSQVDRLQAELTTIRLEALANRSVGFVDWGEIKVYMFTEDLAYIGIPQAYKETHKHASG